MNVISILFEGFMEFLEAEIEFPKVVGDFGSKMKIENIDQKAIVTFEEWEITTT